MATKNKEARFDAPSCVGFTLRSVLEKLASMSLLDVDVHILTTGGRTLMLTRPTDLTKTLNYCSLLENLRLVCQTGRKDRRQPVSKNRATFPRSCTGDVGQKITTATLISVCQMSPVAESG